MALFKKRKDSDRVERRFQIAIGLVCDLDRPEFKRFVEGLELAWKGYDRMRHVQTIEDKENKDINEIDKLLAEH